jgi:hypothetical protein
LTRSIAIGHSSRPRKGGTVLHYITISYEARERRHRREREAHAERIARTLRADRVRRWIPRRARPAPEHELIHA